jgi:hypothetical protein
LLKDKKISLRKHFAAMKKKGVPFLPAPAVYRNRRIRSSDLFEEYNFDDDMLVALLAGKKNEQTYYEGQLQQLKTWLNSCDFCSVHDYAGAVGPVVLKDLV